MHEFLAMLHEEELTPQEIEVRRKFVSEYFEDFSPSRAAIRTGYPPSMAHEIGVQLMNDRYVLSLIKARQVSAPENPRAMKEEMKNRVTQLLLKEAQNHGPGSSHAARVSALAKLTLILGMDAPTKLDINTTERGGVMQVPVIADATEWEIAAQQSQESLLTHGPN